MYATEPSSPYSLASSTASLIEIAGANEAYFISYTLTLIIDKIALSQTIAAMPPLWQKIVTYRYYRDMTQQQVANALGLTQVKVSREEKKILEFMRAEMIR